jgi:hypothetical protein
MVVASNVSMSGQLFFSAAHLHPFSSPLVWFCFSKKLEPAQTRYSAFGCELWACFVDIMHFRHMIKGLRFAILTDRKPLTHALQGTFGRWTLWWCRQLVYIYGRCPDKTPGDKTSGDKTSVDKTSVGTKHPWGQNVRSDKTSVGQNVRGDKRSVGQNVRRTKCPWGQNVRGDKTSVDKTSVWVIFTRALQGNISYPDNIFYWEIY